MVVVLAISSGLLSAPADLVAQSAAPSAVCSYDTCALNVVPAWNGLAVVRGQSEDRVALLGFFKAGNLDAAFAGDPAALALAHRAVRTRRVAATLTDAGLVLLLLGSVALPSMDADGRDTPALYLVAGAVSLGLSVPLQFAADGHLSRAVWQFNRRFAATPP